MNPLKSDVADVNFTRSMHLQMTSLVPHMVSEHVGLFSWVSSQAMSIHSETAVGRMILYTA